VKKLFIILPIITCTACSSISQRDDGSESIIFSEQTISETISEKSSNLPATEARSVDPTTAYSTTAYSTRSSGEIIHTAMSAIDSPTSLSTTRQQLRADPQWNALANEVVYCLQALSVEYSIENSFDDSLDSSIQAREFKKQSFYVAKLENTDSELKAFRSMVMTKLVQNGFRVTFSAKNAYYLKYDIINNGLDDDLVVRVAVINGDKVMTKSRELASSVKSSKREEILRLVRNHKF